MKRSHDKQLGIRVTITTSSGFIYQDGDYLHPTGEFMVLEDGEWRFISDYSPARKGLMMENLRIYSQGQVKRPEQGIYAIELEYHDVHCVRRHRAEQMAATLSKIERKLRAMDQKYGSVGTSFGKFVARVADAVDANVILMPKATNLIRANDDRTYGTERESRIFGDAAYTIDYAIGLHWPKKDTA